MGTRRADMLCRMAQNYLGGESAGNCGGDRCALNQDTSLDTLKADGDGTEAELDRS